MEEGKELQIIGAGFGRTGTISLREALHELGFGPCYHMIEVLKHREHIDFWSKAGNAPEQVDFNEVFADYRSTLDFPACSFYKEIYKQNPNAKVILTVRDFDNWYTSAMNTIYPGCHMVWGPAKWILSQKHMQMTHETIWDYIFEGRFTDKEFVRKKFNEHIEDVKATIPNDKLLVYSVKEGWKPLCEFLEVPVPNIPFPHLNNTQDFKQRLESYKHLILATNIIAFSVPTVLLGVGAYFFMKSRK